MKPLTKKDIVFPVNHRCKSDGCGECIKLATITCRKVLGAVELLKQKINDEVNNVKNIIRAHQKNEISVEFWRGKIAGLQEANFFRDEVFDIQDDEVGEE